MNNDIQLLIDCVADSETVIISRGLELNPARTVRLERSIRITAIGLDGVAPRWTCAPSEGRDQIAIVR